MPCPTQPRALYARVQPPTRVLNPITARPHTAHALRFSENVASTTNFYVYIFFWGGVRGGLKLPVLYCIGRYAHVHLYLGSPRESMRMQARDRLSTDCFTEPLPLLAFF